MNVYKWYKASRVLYLHHIPILPMLIKGAIRVIWGGVLPYQADIGEGTLIGYQGIGVVIHKQAVIGKNCHISQNVTIGGGGGPDGGLPVLGDNVMVGAGAVILGNCHIGENSSIGANAVVLSDIPANSVAVGVPAKVIKTKKDIEVLGR